MNRKQGPEVKKLICRKMAQIAIPPDGDFTDGLKFLSSKENIIRGVKEATDWVFEVIDLVKNAPDGPNDDEEIAKIINKKIEEKRRKK